MARRLANYFSYPFLAIPRALMIRADVVLAMTDPPVAGIAGALIATPKRRPLVYNIRDLYPEMALSGRVVRPTRWVKIWEKLHRWALRQAARVIVLGDDARERIIAKGVPAERIVVVRDGAKLPSSATPVDHPVTRDVRSGFRFVVLHAGNLGFCGAWQTVVEAALRLNGNGAGFVLVGDGAMRREIEATANGCHAIRFLPFRPAAEVPYVLAADDVHLVTIRRGLEGVVVPSKLYPILAAGRPVLALASEDCDAARLVRRIGCGVVADPENPTSVATLVEELAQDPERVASMSRRAQETAASFAMDKELGRFRQVIEEVA